MAWLARIRLGAGGGFDFERLVADGDLAGLAVEFAVDDAGAIGMGVAHGEEFDDERFAGFDVDGDFFADGEAVEEDGGGENADVVVLGWMRANSR